MGELVVGISVPASITAAPGEELGVSSFKH
jgi:hypothetical protein